jgi:ATP-dependent Clp protease ATP-binding subunit ClpA
MPRWSAGSEGDGRRADHRKTIEILHGIRKPYVGHHDLEITDEAIEAARPSGAYVPVRFLPGTRLST